MSRVAAAQDLMDFMKLTNVNVMGPKFDKLELRGLVEFVHLTEFAAPLSSARSSASCTRGTAACSPHVARGEPLAPDAP